MSYILDALKRSEQDRHQKKMANLSSDMMLLPSKQKKRIVWPYLLMGVLLLNVAVYSYVNWRSSPVNLPVFQENKGLDTDAVAIPSRPIPEHLKQKPILKKIAPIDRSVVDKTVDYHRGTLVDGGLLIEPKVRVDIPSDMNIAEATTSQTKPDPFKDIANLTSLNKPFQRSIPALTFNSHIYSDMPSARRVMINNLYLREGDGFEGMTLLEIGEFYILLEKDRQLFKLPVLRNWQAP